MPKFGKILPVLAILLLVSCSAQELPVNTYDECVKAGNVILRSMPPQCVTRDGERFIADMNKPAPKAEREEYCKDMCGDGACQQIVCMAVGCPCSESKKSCPDDCR